MIEDVHKMCRTCLAEVTDYKCLFDVHYINEENFRLSEILTACTAIEVLENDNLPKQVCIKCENNILNVFSFQQLCHKSDSVLKAALSQSGQPQLELKPLVDIEEANSILNYNTSKVDNVNHLIHKVENTTSYSNESMKEHLSSGKLLNEDSGCLANTGSHNAIFIQQDNTFHSCIERNQGNDLPSYQGKEDKTNHKELQTYTGNEAAQSLEHENYFSTSYHSASVKHVELKSSSVSSRHTFKQVQVNNLVDADAQLSSVKILKEDNDYDERNFGDQASGKVFNEDSGCLVNTGSFSGSDDVNDNEQEHTSYSFNGRNQEDDLPPSYQAVEEETTHKELHTYTDDEAFQPLSPLKNENNSSSSYHTESVDSQDMELKPRGISSEHNLKQDQVNNSDEDLKTQFISSVKILKEEDDDDETNFGDQGERSYPCNTCGKTFLNNSSLTLHSQIHSGGKPCVCSYCGKGFANLSLLRRHMKIHTGEKPYQCNICTKIFMGSTDLTRHIKVHTGNRPYSCDTCGKSFTYKSRLILHSRIHSGEKPYVCTYCGRGFVNSSLLGSHTRIHTGERPHQCNLCTKSFIRIRDLDRHINAHKGERPYSCNTCGKSFLHHSSLTVHSRIHSGEKPYVCTYCGSGFVCSSVLRRHTRIHTGEKPHRCNLCTKSFINSAGLKRHIKVHTSKKPYSCNTSGKSFPNHSTLNAHSQINSEENPFLCTYCGKDFASLSLLMSHTRIHTGEKPISKF